MIAHSAGGCVTQTIVRYLYSFFVICLSIVIIDGIKWKILGAHVWGRFREESRGGVLDRFGAFIAVGRTEAVGMVEAHAQCSFSLFSQLDFIHYFTQSILQSRKEISFLQVAQNWVTSCRPVGAREKRRFGGVLCASAGTPNHEETSWKAFDSVFEYIEERFSKGVANGGDISAASMSDVFISFSVFYDFQLTCIRVHVFSNKKHFVISNSVLFIKKMGLE